ncbi:hypothetical protein [Austwickia chelonae]|uniref:hypothetical protein n=1 Tax=Austwickia chelonae TaxID=100225 RepID=UPI0013C2BA05|nr:hypothetical protein [Austwickia chelonae]
MSMTSVAMMVSGSGGHGHEPVWDLPIPAWSYGAIALAAFMLLLFVTWCFRNAGHTLMEASDVVAHGQGSSDGSTRDGHGSTR